MAHPVSASLPPNPITGLPANPNGVHHPDDTSKPTYAFDGRGTVYMPRLNGTPGQGNNYHANYSRRRRAPRRSVDSTHTQSLGGQRSWGGGLTAGGSVLPSGDTQPPVYGPGGSAVATLTAYGGQQTNHGIVLPDPVTPANANVDKLIELFKESGEYDRLRKEVFARFQKSEMRTVLLSRIDGVANECLEKDTGVLQKSAETATEELIKEIDTYPFVERQVLCVPIWREDEWIAGVEHSIFNLLHDRPVHAPPPVEPSIPPPAMPEPPKGPPPSSRPWRHILPEKVSSSSSTPNAAVEGTDSRSPMPPPLQPSEQSLFPPPPVPSLPPSIPPTPPMPQQLPPLRMMPGMPPLPFPPPQLPGMPGMPGMPMSMPPPTALLPGARPPPNRPPFPWQLPPGMPPLHPGMPLPPPGMLPPPTAFVGYLPQTTNFPPHVHPPPPSAPIPLPPLTNGFPLSSIPPPPDDDDLSEDDMAIDDD